MAKQTEQKLAGKNGASRHPALNLPAQIDRLRLQSPNRFGANPHQPIAGGAEAASAPRPSRRAARVAAGRRSQPVMAAAWRPALHQWPRRPSIALRTGLATRDGYRRDNAFRNADAGSIGTSRLRRWASYRKELGQLADSRRLHWRLLCAPISQLF